ncbi:unnamed protein product [Sphenostylis stenocarpa]|uniref:Uncharacterized protein n=1 Tax=Sphenostylis stenocarpa TaxID=92480 RepID=A0AA86TDP9_9FABA|nr:unnamed protein product [Sphenostylis stenocarpa]
MEVCLFKNRFEASASATLDIRFATFQEDETLVCVFPRDMIAFLSYSICYVRIVTCTRCTVHGIMYATAKGNCEREAKDAKLSLNE